MKNLKLLFMSVLLFSVFLFPCFVLEAKETEYTITESELIQLELNNQMLIEQMAGLKTDLIQLNQSLELTQKSLMKLEKEKKILKNVTIVSVSVALVGGFFIGYKIPK